jgi:hypothetical protein
MSQGLKARLAKLEGRDHPFKGMAAMMEARRRERSALAAEQRESERMRLGLPSDPPHATRDASGG